MFDGATFTRKDITFIQDRLEYCNRTINSLAPVFNGNTHYTMLQYDICLYDVYFSVLKYFL